MLASTLSSCANRAAAPEAWHSRAFWLGQPGLGLFLPCGGVERSAAAEQAFGGERAHVIPLLSEA